MDESGRPLSPFLNYRWGVTNTLSILHRITGVWLSVGILVLACWLISIATGPQEYAAVADFYGSTWFKLPLAGWVFCFFYHLANGVRHLVWDAGSGFGHAEIRIGGVAVVVFAVVATVAYSLIGLV
jgi:succinate dehydrogenase / fumarate reductase, cytochrome b subunit